MFATVLLLKSIISNNILYFGTKFENIKKTFFAFVHNRNNAILFTLLFTTVFRLFSQELRFLIVFLYIQSWISVCLNFTCPSTRDLKNQAHQNRRVSINYHQPLQEKVSVFAYSVSFFVAYLSNDYIKNRPRVRQ